jgi:hypothetical protein
LLRYLRYGNCFFNGIGANAFSGGLSSDKNFSMMAFKDINLNILPLAAYQKIYCDWFRFEQWEKACPYTYNFDYYAGGNLKTGVSATAFWDNDNFLTLRYANYNKDVFMGLMPNAQFGSVATVNIPANSGSLVRLKNNNNPISVLRDGSTGTKVATYVVDPPVSGDNNYLYTNFNSFGATFDILSFRIAEASQKYKEVTQCTKQGYKEQLEAHWNVRLSESLSDH